MPTTLCQPQPPPPLQAHGSGNFPAIGLALQRALLLSLLTCLPLLALYAASPWVLCAALGQEAGLAAAAGRYTRIFAPKVGRGALGLPGLAGIRG